MEQTEIANASDHCQIKYDTIRLVWYCETCGYERKKSFLRKCGPPPKPADKNSTKKTQVKRVPRHLTGPGTELRHIFNWLQKRFPLLSLKKTPTCNCKDIERKMNLAGCFGCKERLEEFSELISQEARKRISLRFIPGKKAIIKRLILLAIKRAEKAEWKMKTSERDTLIENIKNHLNGRTLDEAIVLLTKCEECPKFQNTYCRKDRGCDKQVVFISRLAVGYCQEWESITSKSIGLKYYTTAELIADCYKLVSDLPHDLDLIVGAARSGLLPATALSCHFHLPLASVTTNGIIHVGHGWRLHGFDRPEIKKILFIEDTVYGGRTMLKCMEVLKQEYPNAEIIKAAVYVHPKSIHRVDFCAVTLPGRHYLEWNFFNSVAISRTIFDFDGILCEDIRPQDDDDGEKYLYALQNATPKHYVRREPMPMIVTARLEKYREVTLQWLERHGMSCKKLIMGPWNTNEERMKPGEIARFKAGIYASHNYSLFVESDPVQSQAIADITGKEVLCPGLKRVLIGRKKG